MAFLVSFLAARFALIFALNAAIPASAVYADSTLLAIWYSAFALTDGLGVILLLWNQRHSVALMLYLSAVWSSLLALEQVFNMDVLQAYDSTAQTILTLGILLALASEVAHWIRSRRQSSSLQP